MAPMARREESTTTQGVSSSLMGSRSDTQATAPFFRQSAMKAWPSTRSPLKATNSAPGADNYVMGPQFNALAPTGIDQHWTDEQQLPADDAIYSLQGVRLSQEPAHGVFIKNGVKYSK